jgi:nucleotide-binding universal stress UspA family protein
MAGDARVNDRSEEMNRIIVPLDGSGTSESAVRYGALLARTLDRPLLLVHIIDTNHLIDSRALAMLPDRTQMARYLGDVAVREGIEATVEIEVIDGSPAEELLRLAGDEPDGMIVMTTHGRGGLGRIMLGSVADRLVRDGTAPVVLIRAAAGATPPSRLTNLIVTLDGSELAERALPMAIRLARHSGATLRLLRIVEPLWTTPAAGYPPELTWLGSDDIERITEEIETDAVIYLDRAAASLREDGIDARPVVAFGKPADEIARVQAETEPDLILMASHGRSGLRRWLLGSVTTSVIHHASAPLLVVPSGATVLHTLAAKRAVDAAVAV